MLSPLIWPRKEPNETLDYQIDATTQIAATQDTITGVTAAVSPSGPGEMVITQIAVAGSFVTIWLSGGFPARVYYVNVQVAAGSGRTHQFPIIVPISPELAIYPVAPPKNPSFGAPSVWSAS